MPEDRQDTLPAHPIANPAVPIVPLRHGVHIGYSGRGKLLGDAGQSVLECLPLLREQAPLHTYTPRQRHGLLALLRLGALLAAPLPSPPAGEDESDRSRLHGLVNSMARTDAGAVLAHRRQSSVAVVAPRGWNAVAAALGRLDVAAAVTPESAALVVLVGRMPFPRVSALMRRSVPHLAVVPRHDSVRVGPLVVPSATPCLQCLHLARSERDPEHPRVALRWERGDPEIDPVLVDQAALLAARLVSRHLDAEYDAASRAEPTVGADGSHEPHGIHGRFWRVSAAAAEVTATRISRHPLCDCWWEPLRATG